MATMALEATPREGTGKGPARRLRAAGMVPAVLYGVEDPVPVAVPDREVTRLLTREGGDHALIELSIGGAKKGVIVRDYQVDPITGAVLHCDFYEVQKGHKVTVTVGIEIVGDTPQGVREEQGILQHQLHELELDCLPDRIPDVIRVDASHLGIGDSIHVADLALPEGVRSHQTPDTTVVSILPPKVEAEEAPAPAAEGAVPEGAAPAEPAPAASGEESG
jgi:large subunit ribosomal protein L25